MPESARRGLCLAIGWITVGLIVTAVQMPRAFEFVLAHRVTDESWLALFLPEGWWEAVAHFITSVLGWIAGIFPSEIPLLRSRAWLVFAMMVTAALPAAALFLQASRRKNVFPFMLLTFSGGALSLPITAWVLVAIGWVADVGNRMIAAIRGLLAPVAPWVVEAVSWVVLVVAAGLILVGPILLIKSVGIPKAVGIAGVLAIIVLLGWYVFSSDLFLSALAWLRSVTEWGLWAFGMMLRFILYVVGIVLLPIVILGAFLYVGYCVISPLFGALRARCDGVSFGNAIAGMGVTWSVHFSVLATGAADLSEAQHLPVWGVLVDVYRFLTPDIAGNVFREIFAGYSIGMDVAFLGAVGLLTLVSLLRVGQQWAVPAKVPPVLFATCVAVGLAMATEMNIVGGLFILIASRAAQAAVEPELIL